MRIISQTVGLINRVTTDGTVRESLASGERGESDSEATEPNLDRSGILVPSHSLGLLLKSLGLSESGISKNNFHITNPYGSRSLTAGSRASLGQESRGLRLDNKIGLDLNLSWRLSPSLTLILSLRDSRAQKQSTDPTLRRWDKNGDIRRQSPAVRTELVIARSAAPAAGNTDVALVAVVRTAQGLIVLKFGASLAFWVSTLGAGFGVEDAAAALAAVESSDDHFGDFSMRVFWGVSRA